MYALGTFQGDLIAVGTGNLIFRQKGMQWERVRTRLHAPQGYADPGYAAVEVTDNGGLYVCGAYSQTQSLTTSRAIQGIPKICPRKL